MSPNRVCSANSSGDQRDLRKSMESKCKKTMIIKRWQAGIQPSDPVILQEERPERIEQAGAQHCWYGGGGRWAQGGDLHKNIKA